MQHNVTLTNSEIKHRIEENVHNQRDRRIMHLRFVDGYTYEKIGEIVEISTIQVKRIVKKLLYIML